MPHKDCEARRNWQRQYTAAHRGHKRVYDQAYHSANRQKHLAQQASYREKNREKITAWFRAYRIANREKRAAETRDWARRNPDKARLMSRRGKLRRRGAPGMHTHEQWLEKVALFAGCCAYCGERRPLDRDHDIPVTLGGSNDISNILPACRSCNSSKHTRTAREFIASRRALTASTA